MMPAFNLQHTIVYRDQRGSRVWMSLSSEDAYIDTLGLLLLDKRFEVLTLSHDILTNACGDLTTFPLVMEN